MNTRSEFGTRSRAGADCAAAYPTPFTVFPNIPAGCDFSFLFSERPEFEGPDMKCPECSHSQPERLPDKEGRLSCERCSYEFVFDPRQRPFLTDEEFGGFIGQASLGGQRSFTREHLFERYATKKWNERAAPGCITTVGVIAFVSLGISFSVKFPFLPIAVVFGFLFALALKSRFVFRPPPRTEFEAQLEAWTEKKGDIEGLITKAAADESPSANQMSEGVDKILVVQRDILVDWLVANRWPTRHKVLIVSENGYPDAVMEPARALLRNNATMPIFLLHDSTPIGAGLSERMEKKGILPLEGRPVVDIGLSRDDVRRLRELRPEDPRGGSAAIAVDRIPQALIEKALEASFERTQPLKEILREPGTAFDEVSDPLAT